MFSRYLLKKTLGFSAVAVGLFAFVLSCDNPFSNNLGSKVDIAPPTIAISSPVSGEYISGMTRFTGRAAAYRELLRVEYQIFANETLGQPSVNWTSEGIVLSGDAKNKVWSIDLDTLLLNGGAGGSGRDGSFKIQFRAIDNNISKDKNTTPTAELVYIIKNRPSDVKLTAPDSASVENDITSRIMTGEAIRGQITDRRGLKPGYPMIKLWPEFDPDNETMLFNGGNEPDDDDENWGWVSMFLPGTVDAAGISDDPEGGPERKGTYANRNTIVVKRAVQFSFKLDKYTIDKQTRQAVYELNSTGDHIPLESGKSYFFRIKTRDTFFDSETQFPRDAVRNDDPLLDEVELDGYYPSLPNDPFVAREKPAKIALISSEIPPTIEIDNTDITDFDPKAAENQPNIYITELLNNKKIAVNRNGTADFRLRVITLHADSVAKAVLTYNHVSSGRSGFLKWKEVPGGHYIDGTDDATMAEEGYTGESVADSGFGSGKVFTFEADGGLLDVDGLPIFRTSSESYTLTVNAYAVGSSDPGVRTFTIYMDGEGPNVNILSMRAYSDPVGSSFKASSGGRVFDSPYVVNGNIWGTVYPSDVQNIIKRDNQTDLELVKWYVEETSPFIANDSINPDALLSKIDAYRTNPSAAGLKLAFEDIGNTRYSGWIQPPKQNVIDEEEKNPNFKFNTFKPKTENPLENFWDGKDLWLYVIAQDDAQNLGFILRKLSVNDATDIPTLDVPTLSRTNAAGIGITGPGDLDVIVASDYAMSGNWDPNNPRKNVLEGGEGIYLDLTDDDGIALNNDGIKIVLTDLNGTSGIVNSPATLTTAQIAEIFKDSSDSKARSGILEQRTMADALYLNMDTPPAQLRSGMYKIEITVKDDVTAKVKIDGNNPGDNPEAKSIGATYWFAVFNDLPEIIVDTPEPGSLQNETIITMEGRVRSTLKAQQLRITFEPDIINSPPSMVPYTQLLPLYLKDEDDNYIGISQLAEFSKDSDGKYTYYWKLDNVQFDRSTDFPAAISVDWRNFTLEVFDQLGNQESIEQTVQVDKTPPEVSLFEFNYFRDAKVETGPFPGALIVNGKVPFTLIASDDNGLEDKEAGYVGLKWWLMPSSAGPPAGWFASLTPTDGLGYHFLGNAPGTNRPVEEKNGGRFTGIIDTRTLVPGSYYTLWAIARDKAGNSNVLAPGDEIAIIYVDQDSDKPVLNMTSPVVGGIVGAVNLAINGTATDDDGFDAEKLSATRATEKNKYVQIRFPAKPWNADGTALNNWTNWIDVPGSLNQTGAINFSFKFAEHFINNALGLKDPAFFDGYFAEDGDKYYQIRVTDEPSPGPGNKPVGKNPDSFKNDNEDFPGYSYSAIGANTVEFSNDGTDDYYFNLDTLKPEVFFDSHDPDSTHPNFKPLNNPPTFNTVGNLIAALSGTVKETNITSISFRYGTVSGDLTPASLSGQDHIWDIGTMLNLPANAAIKTAFEAAFGSATNGSEDGSKSITIEAVDKAGNITRALWQFRKDTVGPEIRPRIAVVDDPDSADELSVVTDGKIEGSFFDVHSWIWEESEREIFEYRFDSAASWTRGSIVEPSVGQLNNTANWIITLPIDSDNTTALSDGEHTLDIKLSDKAGNERVTSGLRFIQDTALPVVMQPENFVVTIGGTTYSGPTALTNATQRVFSAAGDGATTNTVFTVTGTVSDNNLTGITAVISSEGGTAPYSVNASASISNFWAGKPNIDWTTVLLPTNIATYTYTSEDRTSTSTLPDTESRLTITPNADTPYVWDWTLTVLEKDIKALRDADGALLNSDSIRRYITITATDKAPSHKAGQDQLWYFYLDTTKPNLDYLNLAETAGSETVFDNSDFNSIAINGTVSDKTKIKDVQFLIAKWDYINSVWTYYDDASSSWQTTEPAVADWSNLGYPSAPASAESSVSINLDSTKLSTNGYPADIFKTEGKYQFKLYITDWSLGGAAGAGNPDTITREFYVDRREVVIKWLDTNNPARELERTYYNNAAARFVIAVGDTAQATELAYGADVYNPNTIPSGNVSAYIRNAAGNEVVASTNVTIAENTTLNGTGSVLGMRYFTITPTMPVLPNGTYTLVLTVQNGARREAAFGNTYRFTLDNTSPSVSIASPVGGTETIAGRMVIQGNAADTSIENVGRIGSVAYYVANSEDSFAAPSVSGAGDITQAKGWYFYDVSTGSGRLKSADDERVLMEINPGTFSWEIWIPNIREITDTAKNSETIEYAQAYTAATAGVDLKWNGVSLSPGATANDEVYKMIVYLVVLDEAGNIGSVQTRTFWLYPEGDRPVVTILNPTVDQLLNGEIKLTGMATDNERVRRVWFRVLDSNTNLPFPLRVPQYNPDQWDQNVTIMQPAPVSIAPGPGNTSTPGWYYANGGGGPSVDWWAIINANELGVDANMSPITVEVVAEDSKYNDSNETWTQSGNTMSRLKSANAQIVTIAPTFTSEEVTQGTSASVGWVGLENTHLRRRAAYRVTVTHNAGLTAIRWLRPDGTWINLIDEDDDYNISDYNDALTGMDANPVYNASTNPGIAAKAVSIDGNRAYQVIIDVNTQLLAGGAYANSAVRYRVQLSATESSNATPITIGRDVYLPIDNLPPTGRYTINPRLVGNAVIGGEAGDSGPVGAAEKVIIWLSRNSTNISFKERAHEEAENISPGTGQYPFEASTINYYDPTTKEVKPIPGTGMPTGGIPLPKEYDGTTTGNWSSIVIDQNDPSGRVSHHGHTVKMGLGSGAKVLDKIWYAEIDSEGLIDGPITVHYMVYDRAGNYNYYTSSLVVMNFAPVIDKIQMATDIRRSISQTDVSFGGTDTNYTNHYSAKSGILARIRTLAAGADDLRNGISEEIKEVSGTDKQVNFNVRNGLFALKVDTLRPPDSTKARNFRVEYVTHATKITDLTQIKAGRVYIIGSGEGTADWSALGAPNLQTFRRGLAFLAAVDGTTVTDVGTGSAWELNTGYYTGSTLNTANVPANIRVPDVSYTTGEYAAATTAEFIYKAGAFGTTKGSASTTTGSIIDFTPRFVNGEFTNSDLADYPIPLVEENAKPIGWDISQDYSLFIAKVFDGGEADVYADFTLLAVRVNNNDTTLPYSQLYDINPKTEGEGRATDSDVLSPTGIGGNRTLGGLWNTGTATVTAKPGHIEPRGASSTQGGMTSLTSEDMGGSADPSGTTEGTRTNPSSTFLAKVNPYENIVDTPWANPAGFFAYDTVSGKVVLRGYAEDDQRVARIDLKIGSSTFTILDSNVTTAAATTPKTGLLKIASDANAGNITINGVSMPRVYFTDTVDRERHRVEWAYIWDTETIPSGTIVGDVAVSVVAYNAHYTGANYSPNSTTAQIAGATITAGTPPEGANAAITQTATTPFNSGFPVGLKKYNTITVQLRPYITGFTRGGNYLTSRSSQGWYAFSQTDSVTVNGFNLLKTDATSSVTLPNGSTGVAATITASNVNAITFDVPTTALPSIITSNNDQTLAITPVRLSVGTYEAANTAGALSATLSNRRPWIQPWNTEYSPGRTGSDLWDDYPCVHIWKSGTTVGSATVENDMFRTSGPGNGNPMAWTITDPSMTIDPKRGTLWESHSEDGGGGGTTTNAVRVSSNKMGVVEAPRVTQFIDPIRSSHIYVNSNGLGGDGAANATGTNTNTDYLWAAFSIIGRYGTYNPWRSFGGIYMHGRGGDNPSLQDGLGTANQYLAESTWYNASGNSGRATTPPSTNQFTNPHIVTHINTSEHIHVSYYDTKDKSLKYRYNLRGTPGTLSTTTTSTSGTSDVTAGNAIPKMWTNLDGGSDYEDTVQTVYTGTTVGTGNIATDARLRSTGAARSTDAGQYNTIAVARYGNNGYPVIAYYDEQNKKLKLAISNQQAPIAASNWHIRDNVIPIDDPNNIGTGQYVSMRIDTTGATSGANIVHIAAFNVNTSKLIYIKGTLTIGNTAGFTLSDSIFVTNEVRVVDKVGQVGKWSSISLDQHGRPWITYMDNLKSSAYGGAKIAFMNGNYQKAAQDTYGNNTKGWEAMHIPARFRVEDERLGLENFPTRNVTPNDNTTTTWTAAVGYLAKDTGADRYRIAYYLHSN